MGDYVNKWDGDEYAIRITVRVVVTFVLMFVAAVIYNPSITSFPYHQILGRAIFVLAMASALSMIRPTFYVLCGTTRMLRWAYTEPKIISAVPDAANGETDMMLLSSSAVRAIFMESRSGSELETMARKEIHRRTARI